MNFDIKRIKFEHNVGAKDKKIRMIAGCVLLALTLFLGNILLLILGIALVASAYTGWCPVYSGLGRNTCETSDTGSTGDTGDTGSTAETADTGAGTSESGDTGTSAGETADTETGAGETAESETSSETEDTQQP